MPPQKISPKLLASLIPFWEIILILSNLGVTAGALRFWGIEPNWLVLVSAALCSVGFYGAVSLTRDVLPLRSGKVQPGGGRVKRLRIAVSDVREEPAAALIANATYLALFCFLIGLYGYFLMFARGGDKTRLILWLAITIMIGLADIYRAANGVFAWTRELLDGLLIFGMPALFLAATQPAERAQLTLSAFLAANLLFYFCDRFLKTMADMDQNATIQDGLFATMIRRGRFYAYAFFVGLAYLTIILFNVFGVQWRLLSPVLFALPLYALLIVLLERVERGGVYRRKLIGALGMAATFFVLYAELITVWIFV